nr:hypothetical protein CFP56_43909 [Quercus suber]
MRLGVLRNFLYLVASLPFFQHFLRASAHTIPTPRPIIIDTDIFSDVDDVGALAIANILHNRGLADLKGVIINTESQYGALAASVTIPPLATLPSKIPFLFLTIVPPPPPPSPSEYATKLAHNFPRALGAASQTPDPLTLYRTLLSASPGGLHLISIGFLANLAALLASPPDHISTLSGAQLLRRKVRALTVMGGAYPGGWEYNFSGGGDARAAAAVLADWPAEVPITFAGLELGASVISGSLLAGTAPEDSPVRAAYEWYVGRCGTARESWDLVAVLYGVLGLERTRWEALGLQPLFRYGNVEGHNSIVDTEGRNEWVFDGKVGGQHWLELAEGMEAASVASVLDEFLAQGPQVTGHVMGDGGAESMVTQTESF